jgi:hypothetical protein
MPISAAADMLPQGIRQLDHAPLGPATRIPSASRVSMKNPPAATRAIAFAGVRLLSL